MARYKYTPKDIYEVDFAIKMRGYDKEEVDEMLDNVIVDYETYAAEVLRLQEENEFLKNRLADFESGRAESKPISPANMEETQRFSPITDHLTERPAAAPTISEPSNFDLLKRINRLERAVFGGDSPYSSGAGEMD